MKSIRAKILIYLLVPAISVGASFLLVSNLLLEKAFGEHTKNEATVNVSRLADLVKDSIVNNNPEKVAQTIFDEKEYGLGVEFVAVFNESGKLLAHTFLGNLPDQIVNSNKDIQEAVLSNVILNNKKTLLVEQPIFIGLHKIGSIKAGYNAEEDQKKFNQALYLYVFIFILVLAATSFLAFKLSQSIIKAIENLNIIAQEFSAGNFKKRARITTQDEIGKLAEVFNEMADNLEKNKSMIEAEKEETQRKIIELEAWQKATVGRELRMAELKKRIKKI